MSLPNFWNIFELFHDATFGFNFVPILLKNEFGLTIFFGVLVYVLFYFIWYRLIFTEIIQNLYNVFIFELDTSG